MTTDSKERGWVDGLRYDERGLIPAIVQDAESQAVLMLAYMNRDSLLKTLETGQTWFWSRSRNELWNKGATSGHVQQVQSIAYDCDRDALLLQVKQTGAACHTGAYTCFFEQVVGEPGCVTDCEDKQGEGVSKQRDAAASAAGTSVEPAARDRYGILTDLIETIDRRYAERPEGAYTTYLFAKGIDKILKKVGEEATEVIVAAKNGDAAELVAEAGDLLYHLLVLLKQQGIPFDAVLAELEKRHGAKDMPNKTK
ncbi:bifunctional phosphoribosyl-AMP cyclohydrolase/phosphoribosyl-ATP diphosphatase HisIE [Effusibacillus pohliae]|uniref:bifunctional phosphoribosyl-AMP cyclohydrolase/phosphoribosyl-ATP diphosphatase HisIE n=1 Tax=Effusibacillus pohliae TaxID=232270 RepID=UPI00039A686B|nr:bifunctional phosphoribosyl-AMP cyclohydrolase/phosphoribosyl-ATP diphosphatase HisIE [Effusibacillus pohliae]